MEHLLPALPFDTAALEPHVDTLTVELHHGECHRGYVAQLNALVGRYPELEGRSAAWLLLNPGKVPEDARIDVRNAAGGHVNHSLYWRAMSAKGEREPSGRLADAIARNFGSFETFRTRFEQAGAAVLGSGWVWLARAQQNGGLLRIFTTSGHANPLLQGHFPILVNDVWEHAYYLKHHGRRAEYLEGWWSVVNWAEAARRFELSDHTAMNRWAAEGNLLLETA